MFAIPNLINDFDDSVMEKLALYDGRYVKAMDYNPKTMFPSISKHFKGRDPEFSWVQDAEGKILLYLGDEFQAAYRVATASEVSNSPYTTTYESRELCPFIGKGQYLIKI
jgi:hypothetical protein